MLLFGYNTQINNNNCYLYENIKSLKLILDFNLTEKILDYIYDTIASKNITSKNEKKCIIKETDTDYNLDIFF
jgi:hypothetical protein